MNIALFSMWLPHGSRAEVLGTWTAIILSLLGVGVLGLAILKLLAGAPRAGRDAISGGVLLLLGLLMAWIAAQLGSLATSATFPIDATRIAARP